MPRRAGATATATPSRDDLLGPSRFGPPDERHDPGPDAAAKRRAGIDEAAVEPIPAPAGGNIRIGTASWTDPTMTALGVFYPTGAETAEERLAYYASRFP